MKDYKGDMEKVYALGTGNEAALKQLNIMMTRHTARMVAVLQASGVNISTVQDLASPMTPDQVASDMGV